MIAENPLLPSLLEKTGTFPALPGVYLMRDGEGEVIYIGKAKSLRARVRTYFLGGDGRSQIEFLMRRVHDVEKIVTENEEQAFILERDLILKHKPRYNIRLKDDKAFLSVRIDENAEWPRLELVRRLQSDGARYFGPYSSGYELRELLEIIKRTVPLRSCANTVFYNRQRPCLEYQIKRCAGPCCLPVDPEQYRGWVKQAIGILEGKTASIAKELRAEMTRASEELRFEDAATIRDRIEVLEAIKEGNRLGSLAGESQDAFSIFREEQLVALSVLSVRRGRIAESSNFSFSEVVISDAELLEAALGQFYGGGREIPDQIIVPEEPSNSEILKRVLAEKREGSVEFVVPKIGVKARLLGLANVNAHQHFLSTFDAENRYQESAKELAKLFRLKQVPRRIECIDISNLQGSDIVGALVSFFDGEPDKNGYRKFKISHQDKPDDFASIYEVTYRRLERGLSEGDLPDVFIIDGGKGQLSAAIEARERLKVSVDIVALAKMKTESDVQEEEVRKKPERVFLEGEEEPIVLDEGKPYTQLLKRIRDEVHRFVIGYHRQKRGKRAVRSILDEIPGVGPDRRRRLLREFGSVKAIKDAPLEQIAKAGRMPKPLAEKIMRVLKRQG